LVAPPNEQARAVGGSTRRIHHAVAAALVPKSCFGYIN
jgi:hypothetical protein